MADKFDRPFYKRRVRVRMYGLALRNADAVVEAILNAQGPESVGK